MAHILLAEDDASMRVFIRKALERAGHTVHDEPDGMRALDCLKLQKQGLSDKDFDLLLTDIVMPGLDGVELSQKAMQLCPDIKVMFITGFAAVAMKNATPKPEEQQAKVLSKPFHLNDLVKQVDILLKKVA